MYKKHISESEDNDNFYESVQSSFEEHDSSSEEPEKELDPDDPNDIRNIVIEIVDKAGNFGLGIYGDFKVYVMLKNNKEKGYVMGYVNATKLCALAGKRFDNWLKNKESKKMIASFSGAPSPRIVGDGLLITITGGNNNTIRGTYADRSLIPFIAAWASHDFAKRVSVIVNKVLINEVIEEKNKELYQKQCKIDRMSAKIDRLLDATTKQQSNIEEQKVNIKRMKKLMKRMATQNDDIYEEVHEVNGKLSTVVDARVVPTSNHRDNNMLVIIKNNDDPEDYSDYEVIYEYYCMRIMVASYNTSIAKHRQRHPNMEILMKLSYSPNSINLFKRVKDGLKNKIDFTKCSFNLREGYTEEKLLKAIKKIHDERLNTDDI